MRETASEIGMHLHEIEKGLSGVEESISQLDLENLQTHIQAPLLPELLESYDHHVEFLLADMDIVQSNVTDLLEYHQGRGQSHFGKPGTDEGSFEQAEDCPGGQGAGRCRRFPG